MKSPSTPPTSAIREENEKAYSSCVGIYPGFALYGIRELALACSNQSEDSIDRSRPMRAKPGYISLGQGDTATAEHDLQVQRVPEILYIQGIVRQLNNQNYFQTYLTPLTLYSM